MTEPVVSYLPVLAVVLPLFSAVIVYASMKLNKNLGRAVSFVSLVATALLSSILGYRALNGRIPSSILGGVEEALMDFPFQVILETDALSALMGVLAASIALLVGLYSLGFIKDKDNEGLYHTLLLITTSGMLGLVYSASLSSIFLFLEIASLSSAGLIAFYVSRGESFEAAYKYMMISAVSAAMILFSLAILHGQYGTLVISELSGLLRFTVMDKIALGILVSAFAMKCGAVPLHMWVSDSYGEAPAPISALLVVVSQASLYALFRISFALTGTASLTAVSWSLIIFGVLSMFVGVTMALPQKDVKRLMAYHAISQTGYMLLGVGVGLAVITRPEVLETVGITSMEGGLFHVVNHAMYKGLLFLCAGAIIYKTGTKNLNEMNGLAHTMPYTTVLFLVGALAIAGLPPFSGFASKIMIYQSTFAFNPLLAAIGMTVSILTLASFVKVFQNAFMGRESSGESGEVPKFMLAAMVVLAVGVILFGLVPNVVVESLIAPAAETLLGEFNVGGLI